MLLTTLRRNTTPILLTFVAAGFGFLLIELILMGHTEGSQLVATGAAAAGVLLSLLALVPQRALRLGVAGLFVLLALSGVYGAMEHQADRGERRDEASAALQMAMAPAGDAADAGEVVGEALNSFANNPPILSPLSLSGLALLGLLVLLTTESVAPLRSATGPAFQTRAAGD